jgi:hypothetical protein
MSPIRQHDPQDHCGGRGHHTDRIRIRWLDKRHGHGSHFQLAQGIAVDASGNLYVADTGKLHDPQDHLGGRGLNLAGTTGTFGSADGTGTAARFNWPRESRWTPAAISM